MILFRVRGGEKISFSRLYAVLPGFEDAFGQRMRKESLYLVEADG